MLKRHMSLLYINCKKFSTNKFIGNFCSKIKYTCNLVKNKNKKYTICNQDFMLHPHSSTLENSNLGSLII
jgi:hypothetical protein